MHQQTYKYLTNKLKFKIKLISKYVKSNNKTNNTHSNKHTKYLIRHHKKHQTASAYWSRHQIKRSRKYLGYNIFTYTYNTITNPIHIHTKSIYYLPTYAPKPRQTLPNIFTTNKYILVKYYKISKKNLKVKQYHGYHVINLLALLKCGDIEPNPGRMPNMLHKHPTIHKRISNTYFTLTQ